MKSRFLFAFAFLMCLPVLGQVPTQLGDLDQDGVATVRDLVLLRNHMNRISFLPGPTAVLADLTKDGVVNQSDADEIVREILQTRTPETLPLASVRESSPSSGEGDVALTRETIVYFTMPLAPTASLDTTKFYAHFGGRKILSRVDISSDRKKATLFYMEPLPSNARVNVSLDGAGLTDLLGRPVDLDGDGLAGGSHVMSFDTLSITPVAGTAISGRVFASEPGQGANGVSVDVPLAGATVTVDGAEQTLRTTTDAQGNFTLSPCPAGSFFVHVDGRTSPQSSYPNGSYYPTVGKRWEAVAGRTDNLSGNSEDTARGTVFLPKIVAGSMNAVSQTQDTEVDLPADVLADYPEMAGTKLTVPANSLFADDGVRGGRVGVAPVPPDRLPSPLPPGLQMPMVITIQTDGASNFDRPVPVTMPNLPDPVTGEKLPPGAKSALWSFNHDTGNWDVVGPMTVSEDGNFVTTDVGVGVQQPGWHGNSPACQAFARAQPTAPAYPTSECDPLALSIATAGAGVGAFGLLALAVGSSTVGAVAGVVGLGIAAVGAIHDSAKGLPPEKETALNATSGVLSQLGDDANLYIPLEGGKASFFSEAGEVALEFPDQLPRVGRHVAKWAGAALGVVGVILDGIKIRKEAEACFGPPTPQQQDEINKLESQLLEAKNSLEEGRDNLFSVASELVGERLSEQLPGGQEYKFRVNGDDKLEILNLDRSPYVKPTEINQCVIPIENMLTPKLSSPQFLQDQQTKLNHSATQILRGIKTFESCINTIKANPGIALPNAPQIVGQELPGQSGNVYFSLSHGLTKQVVLRGKIKYPSHINITFAPGTPLILRLLHDESFQIGIKGFSSSSPGMRLELGVIRLHFDHSGDTDLDGFQNAAEEIIGTDLADPDTDGDGISDGAEVKQGTNPLDGLAVATGVIASAPTSAPAIDIAAINNLAVTANGARGVSVFNVLSGTNPTRIAEVDTPGNAVAVSCAGNSVAVADYNSGLALIDLSNPAAIGIRHQVTLGSPVMAVALSGPLAYAGTSNGRVVAVDVETGAVLQTLSLPSAAAVQDLALWRENLYALQVGKLSSISLDSGILAATSSMNLDGLVGAGGRRWRLFAGEGTLYATHTRGFNIIDVATNPNAPSLVQNYGTAQFGWKQIVGTGSGLGIAVTSPNSTNDGPHNADLYTLGPNERAPNFATMFVTPGLAAAASVYNGLAYVADSSAGMQVINYKAYDNQGQAPTITLETNGSLNSETLGGGLVSGQLARFSALVSDDVQVRNVEFWVDGQLVVTDGNYPFEYRFVAPVESATVTSVKIKAKATDTGGNFTWTPEYTLDLLPEVVPPTLTSLWPQDGALIKETGFVYATFSEPIDDDSLLAGFTLIGSGPDGVLDTADDVAVTGNHTQRTGLPMVLLQIDGALSRGLYRMRVGPPLSDKVGNEIASSTIHTFRVISNLDSDGDGVPDDWEVILGYNPALADSNDNGILDGDEDFDGDGAPNRWEFLSGTDLRLTDSNGNGISDFLEDQDNDGLEDWKEVRAGTSLIAADTDNDGFDDGTEIAAGMNPLVFNRSPNLQSSSAATSFLNAVYLTLPETSIPVSSAKTSFQNNP